MWLPYFDDALFSNYIVASPGLGFGIAEKLFSKEIFNTDTASNRKAIITYDRIEFDDPSIVEPDRPVLSEPYKSMLANAPGYDVELYVTEG